MTTGRRPSWTTKAYLTLVNTSPVIFVAPFLILNWCEARRLPVSTGVITRARFNTFSVVRMTSRPTTSWRVASITGRNRSTLTFPTATLNLLGRRLPGDLPQIAAVDVRLSPRTVGAVVLVGEPVTDVQAVEADQHLVLAGLGLTLSHRGPPSAAGAGVHHRDGPGQDTAG